MDAATKVLQKKILADLARYPEGRTYPEVPPKLRAFITEHVPGAEIVKEDEQERIRLKSETVRELHPETARSTGSVAAEVAEPETDWADDKALEILRRLRWADWQTSATYLAAELRLIRQQGVGDALDRERAELGKWTGT